MFPDPINPTRVIGGRYVVLAELGRGGMGIVWRAEDRVMGRQVAVKELRLPAGLSPQERLNFRERLLREARNAGRLNDPGIVTVHDVVSDQGPDDVVRDHIVMELIEARTLSEVIDAEGPLDERAATSVARQLLSALRVAHDRGVVHRDVKPSNVMVTRDGRVKLTDFGIAQAADDPRLTTTGSLVGSPGFLSPERLEGGPATPASDLWALGVTLFHAVQGFGPFTRESTPATISAVLHADVPPVRVHGPLGSVIAGLLQRDPQARLTGVQAAALLAFQDTATRVQTGPIGVDRTGMATALGAVSPGVAPGARRSPWRWAGVALVVGLVVGLVAGLVLPGIGRTETPVLAYGDGGEIPEFGFTYPTCLQGTLAAGRRFSAGASTSCDSLHDLEAFEVLDPFGSSRDLPYPGREQLIAYARAACGLIFDSGVITPAGKSDLRISALVPSEAGFSARSSSSSSFTGRSVICLLGAADGSQLTGTRISKATG